MQDDEDQAAKPDQLKPKQVSFYADAELWRDVKNRAHAENTTVRAIVMRALKAFGFSVPDADLDDRRQ